MATRAQVEANRRNAKRSTGPKHTEATRFNGLKHGLRAEQVVIPGEDPAEFEAERAAWFDEWRPRTHTRAVLLERAAAASWRLRRAARAEAARLHEVGAHAAHDFDTSRDELVACSLHLLPRDPGAALARLRSDPAGLDCLIGLWDDLARAAATPGGWVSRADHHDRLLALLGHPAGSDPSGPGREVGRASLALLRSNDPDDPRPLVPAAASAAAATLRAVCLDRAAEARRERAGYWDPAVLRRRAIDGACAPVTKEAQLIHRYEMAHEKSLYAALRLLVALETSGADLAGEPDPDPVPAAGPSAVPAASIEPDPAAAGIVAPVDSGTNIEEKTICGKLASVGRSPRSRPEAGPSPLLRARPDLPGLSIGAGPGPAVPPTRP